MIPSTRATRLLRCAVMALLCTATLCACAHTISDTPPGELNTHWTAIPSDTNTPAAVPSASDGAAPKKGVPDDAAPKNRTHVSRPPASPAASPSVAPKKAEPVRFETPILSSSENRTKNLQLAAKKLSGQTIKAGEEFSFNRTLGARTSKKGYRKATIFVQGEKRKEVGGGVCQVATTLYNAAKKAGFEITERHEHSRDPGYIELGQDATVYYGQKDLKFINNTGDDYRIEITIGKENVRVELTAI